LLVRCDPLVAPFARLSPEDKDRNPENQAPKSSRAHAWSSDTLRVTRPTDSGTTPTDIGTTPKVIAYLSKDFAGRMTCCAVTEVFNGRGMVHRSMMMFMDMGTNFVDFITFASTKMTGCKADSMITPCDTSRGRNFTGTVRGASSNSGMAKCKVSLIPQWAWLNSLEEC